MSEQPNTPESEPVSKAQPQETPQATNRPGQGANRPPRGPRGGGGGRGAGGPRRRRGDDNKDEQPEEKEFIDKVVHINRCAKVVKGGRRFSFAALVVVGDGKGRVGVGYGKAKEVPECIRKGTEAAHKNLETIELRGNTIPHAVLGTQDGGKVLLRPASPGTGVIAGGGVRAVLEACGIKDVLSKSLGSNNQLAVVFATLNALRQLRSASTIKKIKQPVEA